MHKKPLAVRMEQFRQAKRIHGGFVKLGIALLGVKLARLPIPTKRLRLSALPRLRNKYPARPGRDRSRTPPVDLSVAQRPVHARHQARAAPDRRPAAPVPQPLRRHRAGHRPRSPTARSSRSRGSNIRWTRCCPASMPGRSRGAISRSSSCRRSNCHRVFSPQDGQLEQAIHVPGYRLLVHPPYQREDFPVYTLNERMILRLSTPLGPCLVVMVAGWGVGNISLPSAPEFRPKAKAMASRTFAPPLGGESRRLDRHVRTWLDRGAAIASGRSDGARDLREHGGEVWTATLQRRLKRRQVGDQTPVDGKRSEPPFSPRGSALPWPANSRTMSISRPAGNARRRKRLSSS